MGPAKRAAWATEVDCVMIKVILLGGKGRENMPENGRRQNKIGIMKKIPTRVVQDFKYNWKSLFLMSKTEYTAHPKYFQIQSAPIHSIPAWNTPALAAFVPR